MNNKNILLSALLVIFLGNCASGPSLIKDPITDLAAPQYRKIVLENELKVILVSDDQYNKSAASMNVLAGSLSDPKEHQG